MSQILSGSLSDNLQRQDYSTFLCVQTSAQGREIGRWILWYYCNGISNELETALFQVTSWFVDVLFERLLNISGLNIWCCKGRPPELKYLPTPFSMPPWLLPCSAIWKLKQTRSGSLQVWDETQPRVQKNKQTDRDVPCPCLPLQTNAMKHNFLQWY